MSNKKKTLIISAVCMTAIVSGILVLMLKQESNPAISQQTNTAQTTSPTAKNSSAVQPIQNSSTIGTEKAASKSTQKSTERSTQKSATEMPSESRTHRATEKKPTAVPTEKHTTPVETEPPTVTEPIATELVTQEPITEIPTDNSPLENFLNTTEYTLNSLSERNCQQIITVSSYNGNSADVAMYEQDETGIWQSCHIDTSGYVGSKGVSKNSYEGSYETPYGLYSIGEAFYIEDKPSTNLDSFQITSDTYWIDDPNSDFYNQRQEGYIEGAWNSAEHMIDYYCSYQYGFVINFNTDPIEKGRGSAIFFHCSSSPTAGCVGVPTDKMVEYLNQLDKAKNPYVLIV